MSSQVANSWELVSKLFERCIQSVCNQTSPNFRVIVVCNEKPIIEFVHPLVSYVEVDFLPSSSDVISKTLDRGHRVIKGLIVAQQFEPTHIMFVDADDCISKYIVEFVETNRQHDGWFIKVGYVYKDGSNFIYLDRRKFNLKCGTCNIIKADLYELNSSLLDDQNFILNFYGRHMYITEYLNNKGATIKPLPFRGAIYTVENGENYYCTRFNRYVPKAIIPRLRSLRNYQFVTQSIRNEFGLYKIN